jgi:cytosine permease
VGIEVGQGLGLIQSIYAAFAGGFVLFLVGACTGTIAARTHLSTYVILQFAFGIIGARIVSFVIALTSLGWFAVTTVLFASAVYTSMLDVFSIVISLHYYLVVGSVLMIGTTIFGFKALDMVSLIIVPLLAVFLILVAGYSIKASNIDSVINYPGTGMSFGHAVSAIIGGYIVGMTLLPDLCRYARQKYDGVIGALIGSFIGYPLVLILSALPSIATGSDDYIALLIKLGLGSGGIVMLILATWTTNANNLYSSSLALSTIFTTLKKWKIVVLIGVFGTAIAALGFAENLIGFLLLLGFLVPPVAGIFIADYFVVDKENYHVSSPEKSATVNPKAFAAWLAGSLTGYATTTALLKISGIPSVDAIIVACLLYIILSRLRINQSS